MIPSESFGSITIALAAAAKTYGQEALLASATAFSEPLIQHSNQLERADQLVDTLTYLNTAAALRLNRGWYAYANKIGSTPTSYAGANLTGAWYTRNLNILSNIERNAKPGDRIVVFIGQGHAAMRPLVDASPFLIDVDPVPYLSGSH